MTATVLVVDDSGFMRQMLTDILEAEYEVVGTASTGVEAVQQFEAKSPDVVTMDVMMPEKNGIEATADIKATGTETKVVMCTSVDQKEKMKEAVRAGADGYVTKPVDEADVLGELSSVLD
ncbi:response regulator [Halorussus salilacus]|uniref:response regulator n=1 Tax=Halorussus salilacus TaxID=2953750 RepID=UPI0020A0FF82|nr:response regulator [Halorussus salilacus]USZ69258.1 response regulator [Halorussus salilacus]